MTDRMTWAERVAEGDRLKAEHQAKMEEEHGTAENPKAALLYQKAWDLGHAYGFSEVASHYADLVDLIQDEPKSNKIWVWKFTDEDGNTRNVWSEVKPEFHRGVSSLQRIFPQPAPLKDGENA